MPISRRSALRSMGWLLVNRQPSVQTADVIVVAIDAQGAGTLEASDLVHRGVADRVGVIDDPPTSSDLEFMRRGLPYNDSAAISIGQLRQLGVRNIEQISRRTTGSEQEGEILPAWCLQHGFHSVVVVTSSDHSRRLSRILRRAVRGDGIRVAVVHSPYSEFNPDTWWTKRDGVRTEIIESEKLLLDVICHPFS